MKNLRRRLAVAVAAVALCTVSAPPAQAARGSFVYFVGDSWPGIEMPSPEDGRCHNVRPDAHRPINHTDRLAVLFRGTDCQDGAIVTFMEPGQDAPDHFGSVKFQVR